MEVITEIKIYFLTKTLHAMYDDFDKAQEQLRYILGDSTFWKGWRRRYKEIDESQETRVLLYRKAEKTYRWIQRTEKLSPNKIREIVGDYDIEYETLPGIDVLITPVNQLMYRLKIGGIHIW